MRLLALPSLLFAGLSVAGLLSVGALPLHAAPRPVRISQPRISQPRVLQPPLAASPVDPAAQALLRQMLQAESTLPISGDQITLVAQNGLDISSEQLVQRDGARTLRLDYLRPARLAGEEVMDNSRFYCHLIPAKNTLEISPSRIQSLRVRVPQVIGQIRAGRLSVQQIGQDIVAGHPCVVLQVMVRSSAPAPFQRFWIDPANGAQLRNEQYDSFGQLRSASYYTQVVYNPVFPKGVFRVPSSGKIVAVGFGTPNLTLDQVRVQANFSVRVPAVLPEGFRYQGGSVSARQNTSVVELHFSNGAAGLSVFETPEKPGGGTTPTQHPRHGVLFARQNGLKVVIIANLENAALDSTLASLR